MGVLDTELEAAFKNVPLPLVPGMGVSEGMVSRTNRSTFLPMWFTKIKRAFFPQC